MRPLGGSPHLAGSIAAAAALTLASTSVAGPPSSWVPRGPGGGGAMYSPTINPLQPEEMYVACDMGCQFRTTDFGRSWTLLDGRSLQSGPVAAVRFTRDPSIRWALDYTSPGGGDAVRPIRTTDGGATWQRAA